MKIIDQIEKAISVNSRPIMFAVLLDCRTVIEEQQKRIDACENLLAKWKSKGLVGSSDYARGGLHSRQDCEDELEQALKGSEPKVQEPQACDHIMTEKTQFGDLHQTFECIFCDHKTTEAWVTKHE